MFGSSFESPSPLHQLNAKSLAPEQTCDAGPFRTRSNQTTFRLSLATDNASPPQLIKHNNKIQLPNHKSGLNTTTMGVPLLRDSVCSRIAVFLSIYSLLSRAFLKSHVDLKPRLVVRTVEENVHPTQL